MRDDDYYILTLAAIARELDFRKTNRAAVHLAAGLPLTWVGEQKEAFKAYLLRNSTADYIYRGHEYHWSLQARMYSPKALRRWQDSFGTSQVSICFATSATAR